MVHEVRGVIAPVEGAPVELTTSWCRTRSRRGARARAGLRGLPHRPALPRGGINDEFPFLLGHERQVS